MHQACYNNPRIPQVVFGPRMGLPKKAEGGSKNKPKGGKEKDGKSEEPIEPQITVRNALQVDGLRLVHVLARASDMHSLQTRAVTLFTTLRHGLVLFSCIALSFIWAAEGQQSTGVHVCCCMVHEPQVWPTIKILPRNQVAICCGMAWCCPLGLQCPTVLQQDLQNPWWCPQRSSCSGFVLTNWAAVQLTVATPSAA